MKNEIMWRNCKFSRMIIDLIYRKIIFLLRFHEDQSFIILNNNRMAQ